MATDVAERTTVNKPARPQLRQLAELLHRTLNEAFAKQGFASTELVTRWPDIVGPEISAYSQPEKIRWLRPVGDEPPDPGTLVLRVEGPTAIEIQHQSRVILERVNSFLGWRAVGDLRLRQAPLSRRKPAAAAAVDVAEAARIAATLADIADDRLRDALARLGAAVRQAGPPSGPNKVIKPP
jgi:hypothetical protein